MAFVAPLAGVLALPVFFSKGTHYLYDFPSLTLFTLARILGSGGRRRVTPARRVHQRGETRDPNGGRSS